MSVAPPPKKCVMGAVHIGRLPLSKPPEAWKANLVGTRTVGSPFLWHCSFQSEGSSFHILFGEQRGHDQPAISIIHIHAHFSRKRIRDTKELPKHPFICYPPTLAEASNQIPLSLLTRLELLAALHIPHFQAWPPPNGKGEQPTYRVHFPSMHSPSYYRKSCS